MLRKFRRSSKESTEDSSAVSQCETVVADILPSEVQPRTNFFDLPAEIRNGIYEFVIADATLSLPANLFTASKRSRLPLLVRRRKSTSTTSPINGLLLASRQCRREYLSFLFSTINVVIEIHDFDFENLMRVSSSLNGQEVQSLQSNRNLTVLLMTRNCSSKDLASLRRWIDYRKDNSNNLPWKYEFPLEKLLPPTTMGRVRLLRELEYYADMISTLEVDLDEKQKLELRSIIAAFVSKASKLDDDLAWLGHRSKTLPRNLRGLAGGGVI